MKKISYILLIISYFLLGFILIYFNLINPYGFRDWDWGEFKLHPNLDLEERINQFEILKDHKEELRKRREKFLSK